MGKLWWVLLVLVAGAEDLLGLEIEQTQELIKLYRDRLQTLRELREEFITTDTHLPVIPTQNETDFQLFQAHEASQSRLKSSLEQLLLRKADIELSTPLADFDIFALTTGTRELGVIALCHKSGLIALHETSGRVMGNFTLTGVDLCCGFATNEELYLAASFGQSLVLTSVRPQVGSLQVLTQVNLQTQGRATSIKVSTRGPKRLWVIADDSGRVSSYFFNGTLLRSMQLSSDPLLGIENTGYTFISADKRQLSVINPTTNEVILRCDRTLNDMSAFAVDSSPLVSVLLSDGSMMVFDTQYSVGGGTGFCKAVVYFKSKHFEKGSKIATFPGAALVLNPSGILTFVNTSIVDTDSTQTMVHVTLPALPASSDYHLRVYRTGFGSVLLGLSSGSRLLLFEVLSSYRPPNNEVWLDFGLIRIGAIVAAVLFVLYWNSRKSSSSGQQAEQLQKNLGKLERKMRETQQCGQQVKRHMDASCIKELSRKLAEDQD